MIIPDDVLRDEYNASQGRAVDHRKGILRAAESIVEYEQANRGRFLFIPDAHLASLSVAYSWGEDLGEPIAAIFPGVGRRQ